MAVNPVGQQQPHISEAASLPVSVHLGVMPRYINWINGDHNLVSGVGLRARVGRDRHQLELYNLISCSFQGCGQVKIFQLTSGWCCHVENVSCRRGPKSKILVFYK